MAATKNYDLVVIGAGPGGYVAALRGAACGMKVACIDERKRLGGTCLNVGCIPSKALLHAAHCVTFGQSKAQALGLKGSFDVNFAQLQQFKEKTVEGLGKGIEQLFAQTGVDFFTGRAKVLDPYRVAVEQPEQKLEVVARYIVVATGSQPMPLPFLPFDGKRVLSSTEALSLPYPPKKLLVVGGGAIGVEMASLYHSLGSHVVLVELSEQLCPFLDKEVGRSLGKILSGKGIELKLGAKVLDGKVGEEDVALRLQREQQEEVRANSCLVAIGRRPNARGLGLEEVGVKINAAGQIEVDDTFCSAVPSIFAIGDVIDGPMLAHKASEEAVALVDALAGKASAPVCYMAMPSVVYTDPEVASVGLSEEECVKLQRPIKVGRAYFKGNGRARCSQSEEGFAKVIGDAQTGKLLGVHLVGAAASELIGIGVLALSQKLEVKDLARVPLPHPTLSELLKEAAQAAL